MEKKKKVCFKCEQLSYIWSNINGKGHCQKCAYEEKGKKSTLKSKPYKATGEKELFESIYESRNKRCEVTGQYIGAFDVWCFAHLLSKKAYPSYRLNPANIILCLREIHLLYDNSSREKLLEAYPQAIIMFEKKDALRYSYYNGDETKEPDI